MPTDSPLQGTKVLIVEDHEPSARLMALLLEAAGASTKHVASAEAALAALEVFFAQLVITDLRLPGRSGFELVRTVKEKRAVVAIVVTATNGPKTMALAKSAGCDAFVHKPIEVDSFVQKVVSTLKQGALS